LRIIRQIERKVVRVSVDKRISGKLHRIVNTTNSGADPGS
jgi:hypothetical protein